MRVVLESPLDMHLHLRDEDMLKSVAHFTSKCFSGAIIMPNLVPPITTIDDIKAYKNRIKEATKGDDFEAYMTLFFKNSYDYDFLKEAKDVVKAIKLYPSGVTTNSDGGVSDLDIENLKETLEAMSELKLPLLVHGETNGFVMDREREFGVFYEKLAKSFPKLKIVMEHITDRHSVKLLKEYENLYATITLHHLLLTLDDVIGGSLKPHYFCKPIVKTYADREVLQELALEADAKVMFGSDSAPHPKNKKERDSGAAGIFSAPVLLPALCELFEKNDRLENLQKFVSNNARDIYDIDPIKKEVVIEKREFIVPENLKDIVPMFAGKKLSWRCESE